MKPIKQPVQLATGKPQRVLNLWPAEPLLFKSLVPDDKIVALPAKNFHFVATTIAEHEQRTAVCR